MQKKLLLKTGLIVATLLIFLYGMLGIPKSLGKEGLKQALLERVHLGLDLKGGTHLILQVMVDDAVGVKED
jgi:preprotein translocase subunit SecD